MGRLTVKTADGTDLSPLFNKYEYTVGYVKREGPNGGMMLDGSIVSDILAWKAVLTLSCNVLTAAEHAQLLSICTTGSLAITFFDPRLNADRQASFIPTLGAATFLGEADGERWFERLTLTLTER